MSSKSELALFNFPIIQQPIESISYQDVYPAYKINDNNIEFFLKASDSHHVVVKDTLFHVKYKMTRPANYPLGNSRFCN